MSDTHPLIQSGNRAPAAVASMIESWSENEPPPPRGIRIALGLTAQRDIGAEVFMRWVSLLRNHWWPGPVFNGRTGFGAAQARNLVLDQFFREADHLEALLFWDTDQIPPLGVPGPLANGWPGGWFNDYIDYLIATQHDKDVMAGLYFSREDTWQTDDENRIKSGPHEPLAYTHADDGDYRYLYPDELIPMLRKRDLYPVKGAGTGSMLIRKGLLLDLREAKKGRPIFENPGRPDGTQWTEDLYFCHEVATLLHRQIWLDTAMESGHIASIWVRGAHYLESRGYVTAPHEQSLRNVPVNQSRENERRKARLWTPGTR